MHEQDGSTELLDQLLETNPVGTFVFDGTGELWRANSRAREMVGLSPDEQYVMGERTLYDRDEEQIEYADRPVVRALRGETVEDRVVGVTDEDGYRWFSVNARRLEQDGQSYVVATMDEVTERLERERRLREHRDDLLDDLATVHDRMSDAVLALDGEWRITYLNDRASELLEADTDELLDEVLWDAFPAASGTAFERAYREAMGGEAAVTVEEYYPPLGRWFEVRAYPSETGLFVYFHDVTDRKERERELEEYERLAETHDDGLYVLDADLRFRMVNEAFAELVGRDREDLVGATVEEVFDADVAEFSAARFAELETEQTGQTVELDLPTADGDAFHAEVRYAPLLEDGEVWGAVGTVRDVTERKEREQELERYETIVETIWDGVYALDADERFVMVNETLLDITGYDREELLGRHASTLQADSINDEVRETVEELHSSDTDVAESAVLEHGLETADGEVVPVETRFGPYGGGHGRAGVIRDVSERKERERELRRQREQMAAVNHLYELVRDLTATLLDASSRSAAANLVGERLDDADVYGGGWVAEYDPATGTVSPLGDHPDDPPRTELAADAAAADELRVEEADGRTYAAAPVGYEGAVYGAVVVYTDRSDALDADERAVLTHLGSVVGHVVTALDRKEALVSESVVEATFRSTAAVDFLFEELGPVEGELTIEHVAATDERYVIYFDVSGMDVDEVARAFESVDITERVRRVDGDRSVLEVVAGAAPPFVGTAAAHGGQLEEVNISGTTATLTASFARGTDMRRIRNALRERVPDVELVSTQTVTQSVEPGPPDALDRLTDRQRTAFEAAYYGGYFEWPRGSTAEELADSLGISPPTLHQHLRAAERKLLGAYLE